MKRTEIKGMVIDDAGRCEHWHSPLDVISIKFYCCKEYYPCYECHEEVADHEIKAWPKSEWHQEAVCCGNCQQELSITDYMRSSSVCPNCEAKFNPNCALHWDKYFGV